MLAAGAMLSPPAPKPKSNREKATFQLRALQEQHPRGDSKTFTPVCVQRMTRLHLVLFSNFLVFYQTCVTLQQWNISGINRFSFLKVLLSSVTLRNAAGPPCVVCKGRPLVLSTNPLPILQVGPLRDRE